jgi:HSP20 family molecular chaperone IbpA
MERKVKKSKFIRNTIGLTAAAALSWPLTVSAAGSTTGNGSTGVNPAPAGSSTTNFDKRLGDLESRMDSIFTDTFHHIGNWFEQSKFAASLNVRDEKNNYVVRLYLPNTDTSKVNATIDNNALHITSPGEQTEKGATEPQGYEEIIGLPGPVQADKMQIKRKQDLVVITLPKTGSTVAAAPTGAASPTESSTSGIKNLDQQIVDDMSRMETRMDQLFHDAFPNGQTASSTNLQLGSAVNIDDQKTKYVVHFYLPDRNLSDVNVKYENGQLDLTAQEKQDAEEQTASGTMQSSENGRFQEMITLPGPVKDKDMIVSRKNGAIDVTLPKA